MRRERTVRLLKAWIFGLVVEMLESLRLTASEGLETNWWGAEGGILGDKETGSWGRAAKEIDQKTSFL
jgi:hypothetical protein